ncbi:zinc finger SWIM domain-containing protein 8 isoform X2 [Zootermopsis nevadensis]|uniref:zinc finger SWIM domain-containing protein 8 isoform X2 n=1 Tax=Zootermopsis nevadensis TaxID=136037 RepID=UPI000B8EC7C8|nr:zinc finger SWIM domain-containing protein 8 isoform X2 [Zootermopsis nevadensis]
MLDWEEADRFSFEDSDRFEEDSLCSWSSEPESLCNNWRGWKRPILGSGTFGPSKRSAEECGIQVPSLGELTARCVAAHIPFELVEHVYPPVPEQLQLRIAFWSFPDNEEDIRLYSCLANGSADEFQRGEHLFKNRAVKDPLQIGFHLSASVWPPPSVGQVRGQYNVAVTFDRRRITSCNCTCSSTAYWCSHVVAVCLHRIHQPTQVCLRAPVSESLSRLHREQLQKFAQYLISELPQQILPTAQRLLDELLSSQPSAINTVCGAPDPTAGASANDQTSWYLDEKTLHDNIKKILIKFCVPAPIVFSDVNYLSAAAPPAAAEWSNLLRPLRGREPEGMWNLLSIVREMFKRNDRNAIPLLEIITEECMACEQILVWWFNTKVALHNGSSGHGGGKHSNVNSNSHTSQHACSSLCDEIVVLWRLAALNPGISPEERELLHGQFRDWHIKIVEKVTKSRGGGVSNSQSLTSSSAGGNGCGTNIKNVNIFRNDVEVFTGFKPAIEACYMDWDDYPLPGITYTSGVNRLYHCPFTCFRHAGDSTRSENLVVNQVISSQAVLYCEHPSTTHHHTHHHHHYHHYHNPHLHSISHIHSSHHAGGMSKRPARISELVEFSYTHHDLSLSPITLSGVPDLSSNRDRDGNRSSVSSEGFCENDADTDILNESGVLMGPTLQVSSGDTDSQEGGGSDSASSSGASTSIGRIMEDPCKKPRAGSGSVSVRNSLLKSMASTESQSEDSDSNYRRKIGGNKMCMNFNTIPPGGVPSVLDDIGCFCDPSPDTSRSFLNARTSKSASTNFRMSTPQSSTSVSQRKLQLQSPSLSSPSVSQPEVLDADSDVSGGGGTPPEDSEASRRPSKDESLSSSNSDSQQSGDEYNVYYYDPKALLSHSNSGGVSNVGGNCCAVGNTGGNNGGTERKFLSKREEQNPLSPSTVFANLRKTEDVWDVLFARAEGLHAHGHGKEACTLGVRLAKELLASPPDLMVELPPLPSKGKRKKQMNPASRQLSCLASATLAKCAFLCTVLAENLEHFHLAFCVGMFGLEMARPPASTKPLEVKLANQESELVNLLKRIPLGNWEMKMIRERAEQLKDGTLRSRGEALLPIMLASFIFDVLVIPATVGREPKCQLLNLALRLPTDEALGFEAAVAALGLKANVSEADHPLLCEGTRRQRGDLAIALLVHYKDDPGKVARIMEKLLDREVHQLLKTPIVSSMYSSNPSTKSQLSSCRRKEEVSSSEAVSSPMVSAMGSSSDPVMAENTAMLGPSSRPHSSTSAEVEQGLATLSLSSPTAAATAGPPNTVQQVTSTRTKEATRFKGKRVYPSIPNQPSEAGAHFMFELAKTVLTKAGGNSSTSLFTQASTSQNHHGPHRALHICAFQIGLYALGLHNCVSPNWLSRTYSSHVSWITGQAMEIGAPAISFLIETWEGHLTPPEAVSIADRASRCCDLNIVRAAAELALSCLPHSHALNPNEIQRAILQCKEQSDLMLEHSCLTVENAAKGGGVYPEVLFQVAKYWYELYMRHTPGGGDQPTENEMPHESLSLDTNSGALVTMVEPTPPSIEMSQQLPTGLVSPSTGVLQGNLAGTPGAQSVVVTTTPPPPYPQHPSVTTLAPLGVGMSVPYTVSPYSFAVQGLHPHPHHHPHFGSPLNHHPHTVTLPPPPHLQMYLSPPAFQYPPHAANQQAAYANLPPNAGGPGLPPNLQYYGTAVTLAPTTSTAVGMRAAAVVANTNGAAPPHHHVYPITAATIQQGGTLQVHRQQPQQFNQTQLRYLLAAYRVGMLALETLARRVHDDRPQAKYARNPPYGEDVKWLLRVAKKLGTQYLHQFCVCAVNSVVSPFVLHDVALEAAHYLSRNNPGLIMQHLRSALTPLVQKCQQMYIQCMHQKLYHLTTADYEDFVNIVCSARAAFQITPEGNTQFKEWLQSIRRSKSCKKDLWAQINAALQANSK